MELTVWVKPGSRKGPLVEETADAADRGARFTVFVAERAVDGRANDAVTALLAAHYGVAKSAVVILRGHSSRLKLVRVDGAA